MQNGSVTVETDSRAHAVESALPGLESLAATANRIDSRSTARARRGRAAADIVPPPPPSHGYSDEPSTSPLLSPDLSTSDLESHIHPDLRSNPSYAPAANMMSAPAPPEPVPAAGPPGMAMGPPAPGLGPIDMAGDGRKAKRELSQSKRAAQNRAAQRAFRQRKEGYIKKLEQQVKDYAEMENGFKALQTENYQLRQYALELTSKLLDHKIEPPPLPHGVNLHHQHPGPPPVLLPPHAGMEASPENAVMPPPGNPLAQVAQAVAQLGADGAYTVKGFKPEGPSEEARTAEEISRQLQQPDGLPAARM